jgi:hypothetical protein
MENGADPDSIRLARLSTQQAATMDRPIIKIDDKHVPLYRIVWVSEVPHFCGEEDCMHEGDYEIRLDVDDSLWTNRSGRDDVVTALNRWCGDPRSDGDNSSGSEENDWI